MGKTIIKIDQNAVVARIMGDWRKALPALTDQILFDCNEFCKWDSGDLATSSERQTNFKEGVMIWQTPYAKRQYWEIKTSLSDNPNRTWKWGHVAKRKCQSKWVRQAALLMGGRTG